MAERSDWFHLALARHHLCRGGVVAHATEGVWGLACDPLNGDAVERVLIMKRRSPAKGLILIGAEASMFGAQLDRLSSPRRARVLESWPGPVTWVLPAAGVPGWITGGRATVAVRVPGHDQARALSRAFGAPLVSTSANLAGRPPARTALAVRRAFGGAVDYVLPGSTGGARRPSEIRTADRDLTLRSS